MNKSVYLDNAATTRVDEQVLEFMMPLYRYNYGNASSLHLQGIKSKGVLDKSRTAIAEVLSVSPENLYFTSGGTESNNWALKGIAENYGKKGRSILVSAIEHDCILNTCNYLKTKGFNIKSIPVDENGLVIISELEKLISTDTIMVSVMHANNEIGTIQPIAKIGRLCREKEILFHTDACQTFGKIPVKPELLHADLVTVNSHKIYGPKGVGALYIRDGIEIEPLLHGGGQEKNLRSTTENIPGIAGFAKAAHLCAETMEYESIRLDFLRKRLVEFLGNEYNNFYINGHPEKHLPGFLNFSFSGMEGETIRLLFLLDDFGICVSAGSACSSNHKNSQASHVLQAIGRNPMEARGGIRVSMGRFTTDEDIDLLITNLRISISQLNPIFS